jgi:enamidase
LTRSSASAVCRFDTLAWLQPDIAAHVRGGPIPMSDEDIEAVADQTSFALEFSSMCDLTQGQAMAVATGNAAKAHGLDVGIRAPGAPADILLCGRITGSTGNSVADAIAHGDLPGVTHVLVDGEPLVAGRSRQTPPPAKPAFYPPSTRAAAGPRRRG